MKVGTFLFKIKPPKEEAEWKKKRKQLHRKDEATNRKAAKTTGRG